MKILHLDTQKGFRGGEQQLIYLAQGLKEQGIESIIACTDELYTKANTLGFKTINSNNIGALIKAASKCDLLHAHASKAHTLGIVLKLLTKKPLVYTRRVDYKQKKISKLKYLLTDTVVCVSNFVQEVLYKNYRINSEVIYDTVDTNLLNKVDTQKVELIKKQYGPIIIGNIAALTAQKDHKTLIEAASLLDRKYTFLILGKGELKEELEIYARQKGVDKNIIFLGFRDDIENYLAAFDLFVISSEYEGLCSSILQAFLFKVPVVATNAGGVGELIGNNQRGLLVPVRNAKALAKNIEHLISNKELSGNLTEKAHQFCNHFSLRNIADQHKLIYEKIIIILSFLSVFTLSYLS